MYEIWSLGHKPFEDYGNMEVRTWFSLVDWVVSFSSYYQIIQLVSAGDRLAPPPGCPKAVYSLMIQCW